MGKPSVLPLLWGFALWSGAARAQGNEGLEDRVRELERQIAELRTGAGEHAASAISDEDWAALEKDRAADSEKADSAAPAPADGAVISVSGVNFNPKITIFGDFVGESLRPNESRDHWRRATGQATVPELRRGGFRFQDIEADFLAAVDPYATARVILAAENAQSVEVEEGYATISRLPFELDETLRLSLKAGKFLCDFGPTNRLHGHDLPQTERPLAATEIFGEEGELSGTGLHLDSFFGLFGVAVTPSLELINGEGPEDEATGLPILLEGADSHHLASIAHLGFSLDLGRDLTLDWGGSQLFGRNDQHHDDDTSLFGADLMLRWRPDQYRSLAWQSEWLWANRSYSATLTGAKDLHWQGGFSWLQYQLSRSWYLGVRYDSAQFVANDHRWQQGITLYASYYTTEFLRLRLGLERVARPRDMGRDSLSVLLQLTFVFGSHPAEPYYFNK